MAGKVLLVAGLPGCHIASLPSLARSPGLEIAPVPLRVSRDRRREDKAPSNDRGYVIEKHLTTG